ncbi:MAG: M15 family metallopeptidase [Deltaproteobacteria bacterium]|nr:M15 family metallopeptidase [Deltaproteobacteria bacterium]
MRSLAAALVLSLLAPHAQAGDPGIEVRLQKTPGLVDAAKVVPGLRVELKYSTTDNFLHADVYGSLERCYLQRDAAEMLAAAAAQLAKLRPDLRLLAYDCVRPVSVQRRMWKVVKGTPQQPYVADPNTRTGSIHNYGCAVDLTLADAQGKPLDMGTPFDYFGQAAQPRHEAGLVQSGKLSTEQLANRLLLRLIMARAGFQPIASEWWHFNCAPNSVARKKYKKVP